MSWAAHCSLYTIISHGCCDRHRASPWARCYWTKLVDATFNKRERRHICRKHWCRHELFAAAGRQQALSYPPSLPFPIITFSLFRIHIGRSILNYTTSSVSVRSKQLLTSHWQIDIWCDVMMQTVHSVNDWVRVSTIKHEKVEDPVIDKNQSVS